MNRVALGHYAEAVVPRGLMRSNESRSGPGGKRPCSRRAGGGSSGPAQAPHPAKL